MRILIDLQALQIINPYQEYIVKLTQAIIRQRGQNEIILILNGIFKESIQPIRRVFQDLLPNTQIRVFDSLRSSYDEQTEKTWRYNAAAKLREAFIAKLSPDVILIPSVFDIHSNDAIVTINDQINTPVVVALFDLTCIHSELKKASACLCFTNSEQFELASKIDLPKSYLTPLTSSWDENAGKAIQLFEHLVANKKEFITIGNRKKLAFVSPLPPLQTGIAGYSDQLLPYLAEFYDIVVIVNQDFVEAETNYFQKGITIHNVTWFRENFHLFDRVIYHFGNSHFHTHMPSLIEDIPGVVVLHDFFLSGLFAHLEYQDGILGAWSRELYYSHGYPPLKERYISETLQQALISYPCNLKIIDKGIGTIVHSDHAVKLAQQWYGPNVSRNWKIIPLLREKTPAIDRQIARQLLGISDNGYLVCSFGLLNFTKLNDRLLKAWAKSVISRDERAQLIFVGEDFNDHFFNEMKDFIDQNHLDNRIKITGWVDQSTFYSYLIAADCAVQLRTCSRGESSASVLDCMNVGIATIVNANGSFAALPSVAVKIIPDEFTNGELIQALEDMYLNPQLRIDLGQKAQAYIQQVHSPLRCAALYHFAIEELYANSISNPINLANSINKFIPHSKEILIKIARKIVNNLGHSRSAFQLLVDISAIHRHDLKTGIERVVRGILVELLKLNIPGYRIEAVYITDEGGFWHYRYARNYTLKLLNYPEDVLLDDIVQADYGDLLIHLDWSAHILTESVNSGLQRQLQAKGVEFYSLVYDLLPVLLPQVFPPGADEKFSLWLKAITQFDGAICISKTVAKQLRSWIDKNHFDLPSFSISSVPMGSDIQNSVPSVGIAEQQMALLDQISNRINFLMVGTIEPRKCHWQVVKAFSTLWSQNIDINLIIVGKEGWQGLPDEHRRNIPQTIQSIQDHAELDKRLFWLSGISDEYLEKIYQTSTCLIMASLAEGFGLPLIEAAHHKLPVIARDLPIFREVGGDHVFYFWGKEPEDLAEAIKQWLTLFKGGNHPDSKNIQCNTWKETAINIVKQLIPHSSLELVNT